MKSHHVILTKEEFDELKTMEMVPIEDLPVDQSEKDKLKEAVAKKFRGAQKSGGVAQPMRDPIPRVVCGMVDDSVVCMQVPGTGPIR